MEQTKPEPFAWPPKAADNAVASSRPTAQRLNSARATSGGLPVMEARGLLEHIEHAFLGSRPESFDRWAIEADWSPEPVSASCSRCGRTIGPGEAVVDVPGPGACLHCVDTPPRWDAMVRVGRFDGLLREAVLAAKYRSSRLCAGQLGGLLAERVRGRLRDWEIDAGRAWVVPVPTTTRRRLRRGIDHVRLIAREVAAGLGSKVVPVLRRRHRPSQVSVAPSAREANIRRAMWTARGVSQKSLSEGVSAVVLVDDLSTTGATLREACRALRDGFGKGEDPPLIVAAVACVADGPG